MRSKAMQSPRPCIPCETGDHLRREFAEEAAAFMNPRFGLAEDGRVNGPINGRRRI